MTTIRSALAGLEEARRLRRPHRTRAGAAVRETARGRVTTGGGDGGRGARPGRTDRGRSQPGRIRTVRSSPSCRWIRMSDLSAMLSRAIADEAQRVGSAGPAGLPTVFESLVGDHRQVRRDQLGVHRADLVRQRGEIAGWRREREAIAGEQDQAPPPFAARSSSRDMRSGAPLWAVVDFARGVEDSTAAAVEAALEAANLLDAWVSPVDGPAATPWTASHRTPSWCRCRPHHDLTAHTGRAAGAGTCRCSAGIGGGGPARLDRGGRRRQRPQPDRTRTDDLDERPVPAGYPARSAPREPRRVHRRHRPGPAPRDPAGCSRCPDRRRHHRRRSARDDDRHAGRSAPPARGRPPVAAGRGPGAGRAAGRRPGGDHTQRGQR